MLFAGKPSRTVRCSSRPFAAPAVDPVVRSHPERAGRVFGQTPDFGKPEVD